MVEPRFLPSPFEYDHKTLQEFSQIVSGSRLELNRLDRLDHESPARACGLRDDDCVLGGAHSEDYSRTLAELQSRVQSRPFRQFALTILDELLYRVKLIPDRA